MLRTYLVDGDKGGVGKSLTARALVHYHLTMAADVRPILAVFDADMSNPDVCGKDGLSLQNSMLETTQILDLSIEQGWIDLSNALDALQTQHDGEEVRVIVNMTAQIGSRAFQGAVPIVGEVLRQANAFPIWLLSRVEDAIRTLEERIKAMPARFESGLILRNLFFGEAGKFTRWEHSALRARLLALQAQESEAQFRWDENCLPEINAGVIDAVDRTPFHVALGQGRGKPLLAHGQRLTLDAWLRRTHEIFARMEQFIEYVPKAAAQEG
ncbi:MAG: hypothetical protein LBU72_02180 [Burkholderiaceae bacterium]|jgi:hypothetical protein|nr:hypothetical protein [Burkholderiaceae bacterium]